MVMLQPYVRLLEGIAKNGWRLSKDQSICHAQGEKKSDPDPLLHSHSPISNADFCLQNILAMVNPSVWVWFTLTHKEKIVQTWIRIVFSCFAWNGCIQTNLVYEEQMVEVGINLGFNLSWLVVYGESNQYSKEYIILRCGILLVNTNWYSDL